MTWNECREWAAETMQKTFDGKRWKFAHAAQNIAEKAYVEGVDAGFEAARRIVFADYKKLSEVFPGTDWENIGPYHEYAFENIDGREAVKAWEEYDAEQEDPINKKKEDIIRCGECKFYTGIYCHQNMQYGLSVTESDYCSKGERKDG